MYRAVLSCPAGIPQTVGTGGKRRCLQHKAKNTDFLGNVRTLLEKIRRSGPARCVCKGAPGSAVVRLYRRGAFSLWVQRLFMPDGSSAQIVGGGYSPSAVVLGDVFYDIIFDRIPLRGCLHIRHFPDALYPFPDSIGDGGDPGVIYVVPGFFR